MQILKNKAHNYESKLNLFNKIKIIIVTALILS